ncbi:hypothetical protein BN12_280018 [Nostocoides japonicum T1-X7]|uniref:Uncharacterized protein n=1 Tax=Nostocoides japonicum T1-X7 TaxID=1194083 RepID=A0A077LZR4_9MICO|nr:hypothetical protein BN12_280018 [Tetrasphaera japonica T1-X7]
MLVATYLPLVPERVGDSAHPPTMLDVHGRLLHGPGSQSLSVDGIRIVHHQQEPSGGCGDGVRDLPCRAVSRGRHPEHGVVNDQLSDDVLPLAHAVQDLSTEGGAVEVDSDRAAVNPQLGLDHGHDS